VSTTTLSPSAKAALAQLLANEQRKVLTHRTAMHAATREVLIGRGLIQWGFPTTMPDTYLFLTDEGRVAAHELDA
jgi:hypothetical protein